MVGGGANDLAQDLPLPEPRSIYIWDIAFTHSAVAFLTLYRAFSKVSTFYYLYTRKLIITWKLLQ